MKTKQQYFYNALLLTLVTFLMRTVSVSFNVYVSNRVGAEAMGLLSLVSGVYNFAVTLATSGIHLATVRTISERLGETHGAENRRCLLSCLAYAGFFGTLATVLLGIFAAPIGQYWLQDLRTVKALRLLAFTLLPIALCTVLNGYFTAVRRAWKNALVQVAEQGVKISLTCYLLVVVAPKSVEGCLTAILLGGAVSESLSLILNSLLYLFDRRHFKGLTCPRYTRPISVAEIALPVAISTYLRSGLLTLEHILIPRGLKRFGKDTAAALASYGALQSMALPVILYPNAILSSFASLLIPEVTEQQAADNKVEIRYIAGRVYQMTLLFSIGVSGIMLCLSGELGKTLYGSEEVALFIRRLAPIIPIMYLDTATDAMLKGLGQQVYSMNVNIIDALISVISVYLLVPLIGINGYLVTIYITELFNAALSIIKMLRITQYRPRLSKLLCRPIAAVIGATCLLRIFVRLLPGTLPEGGVRLALYIAVAAVFYLILLGLTGSFGRSDILWMSDSLRPPRKRISGMKRQKAAKNM